MTYTILEEYAAQIANADQMLSVFAEFVPEEEGSGQVLFWPRVSENAIVFH